MEKIDWKCPQCGAKNEDTRNHYVMCVNCGTTFDDVPKKTPEKADDAK